MCFIGLLLSKYFSSTVENWTEPSFYSEIFGGTILLVASIQILKNMINNQVLQVAEG
jgi:hypothetical protein